MSACKSLAPPGIDILTFIRGEESIEGVYVREFTISVAKSFHFNRFGVL